MEAILDAVQDIVAAEPDAVEQPATAQPDDGAIEARLAQEISSLWSDNLRLSAGRKASAKELRQVRARLAERLHAMKSLLSRPGRGGQWRSWLRERGINRSTADRLVARHAETLCNHEEDAPSGAIPEPATPTAEKLAATVWSSSLRKVLVTGESVIQFIGSIAQIAGVPYEWRTEGLVIFNPVPKAADEVTASAPAAGPAPQPSAETPAAIEEPAAEAAATPPAAEQAPAVSDASSGAVA